MPIYPKIPLRSSIPQVLQLLLYKYNLQDILSLCNMHLSQSNMLLINLSQLNDQYHNLFTSQQAITKGNSRVEYREFQRPVVERETEIIQVQVPKTKYVTDYYPIQYLTEYIPKLYMNNKLYMYQQLKQFQELNMMLLKEKFKDRQLAQTPVNYQPLVALALTFSGLKPRLLINFNYQIFQTYPRAQIH